MKNYYYKDDDKKHTRVISTLKELPSISAPPDFEMNLRRKLNNLTYAEKNKEKKPFFLFQRSFVPAAALVFSVIVVFLIVFDFPSVEENPFMTDPELKAEYTSTVNTKSIKDLLIDPVNITSNDVVIKKSVSTPQPVVKENKKAPQEVHTGMAANEEQHNIREFLAADQGHNVDRSLRAKPQMHSGNQGNSRYVSFDGFNLVNEDNDQTLYQLKARMDSLKKFMRSNR